jgi:HlyD family secretion protein
MTEAEDPKPLLKPHRGLPKPLKVLLPVVLVAAIGAGVTMYVLRPKPQLGLQLSGRIEGYETDVGAKVGGKIEVIRFREGDRVRKGEIIAQLDDAELQAALAGATAQIASAEQQVSQALLQISVIESQIQEAQLTRSQSQDDTLGQVNTAKAGVASANAQLAEAQAQAKQLEAELKLAKDDRDRFDQLFRSGAASQQRFEQAQSQFNSLRETLQARRATIAAAQEQVKAAQGNLTQSSATRLNPDIRLTQIQRLRTQNEQARAQLKAAQANLENARASRQAIEAQLQQLNIVSPIDGVVITRTTEPGEVIAAGKTVLTLINLGDVFLRGYIPEKQVGAVRVGQAAQVFLDSAPNRPLSATVSKIDTEASFTPENIYFRDDRVTQVFGLKLQIANPGGFAKPGMPADATILTNTNKE